MRPSATASGGGCDRRSAMPRLIMAGAMPQLWGFGGGPLSSPPSRFSSATSSAPWRSSPDPGRPKPRSRRPASFPPDRPMREDNKNLLLAIVLSVVVLIGWNYFYGVPQMQQQKQAQQTQPTAPAQAAPAAIPRAAPKEGGPAAPVPGTVPTLPGTPVVETREAALQRNPRLAIDTPSLAGSINLRGGRTDAGPVEEYQHNP